MNDGFIKVYALAVCFAALTCGAVTTGFFLYNAVKVVVPEATMDPYLTSQYSSNEAFRGLAPYPGMGDGPMSLAVGPDGALMSPGVPTPRDKTDMPQPSDQEIEKLRLRQLDAAISSHRGSAQQGMILQAIILLICSILFIVHWNLCKKY